MKKNILPLLVLLDIDGTLVESNEVGTNIHFNFKLFNKYEISIRPGVIKFIKWLHEKNIPYIVYTASSKNYATAIIRKLKMKPLNLYHRQDCILKKDDEEIFEHKNIKAIKEKYEKLIIIDDGNGTELKDLYFGYDNQVKFFPVLSYIADEHDTDREVKKWYRAIRKLIPLE